MRALVLVVAILSSLTLLPTAAVGQASVEDAVRQAILDQYAFQRENLRDMPGTYSQEGSVEFWSSGGLLQQVPPEMLREFEFNTLTVKHITVIPLSADVAVAHMYVEGSVHMKGLQPVPNYLTRSTLVMVLENGDWVTRAAHWSPIQGGAGTNQSAGTTT